MKKKILQFLGPVISLVVLLTAFFVLHRLLRQYHYRDVVQYLGQLPGHRQAMAVAFTFGSYFLLTLYDALAVHTIKHRLPYRRIALVSFIGYAFNNNFGFAGLAGNSLRYRIYTSWGLSTVQAAKIIGLCLMAFWMGFLAVAGVSFLVDPVRVPSGFGLNLPSLRVLGVILLAPVVLSLVWSLVRKEPLRLGNWRLKLPPLKISLAQITLAALDWTVAASVFYWLLPSSGQISFPQLLTVFLLAQIAGLISHVPGGLGVFEAVVLLTLTPPHTFLTHPFTQPEIFAAAVAYRGVYYLLPLGLAIVLLGLHELRVRAVRRLESIGSAVRWPLLSRFKRLVGYPGDWSVLAQPARTMRAVGQWTPALVPNVFAIAVFASGAILLFSGATPSVPERIGFLRGWLPGSVSDTAHLLASLSGAALLLAAHGLHRRLDSAFILTVTLLSTGIPLSLLKGFDYEEAIILLVILLALIPCRLHFYRKTTLMSRLSITPAWAVAVGLTVASSIWLGFFAHKHLRPAPGQGSPPSTAHDLSRFYRASLAAIGLVALYGLKVLLKPAPPPFIEIGEADWRTVRSIAAGSPHTYAWLAMLGDKKILLNAKRNAFIMYAIEGRSWIAMGEPVGPAEEKAELLWEFRELSESHGGWTTFYQVGPEHLPLYLDLGLVLVKIGEEAIVPLSGFQIQGHRRKGLRHTYHRLLAEGYRFEVLPPPSVPAVLPCLKAVSDAWLQAGNTPEKGFSLGSFREAYVLEFPFAVVRDSRGQMAAFANVWMGGTKEELSVDMMRHIPGVDPGIMDYLLVELMLWGQAQGWRTFNLGIAPLAGLEGQLLAPLWTRLGSFVFSYGDQAHHLQGLHGYKEKFNPTWRPVYLASPGGIALPATAANLTALISQG